jgi:HK97 family phage portal protein
VEVTDPHPALQVLDRANEDQNGYELTVLQMIDLQLQGNSYMYPLLNALGTPGAVLRFPPEHITVRPGTTRLIDHYEFGGVDPLNISPEEMIHFSTNRGIQNPYMGSPWFKAAWEAIALHDAKRTMDIAVFQNMARPDYLISVKSGNQNVVNDLKKQVNREHRGARNAGKFLPVPGDVDVHELNWKYEEIGTALKVIEEIAAVSGVPIAMLLTNDPTKASSTMARLGWYRNTVRNYCRLHEEKLNQRYLPMFEGWEDMFLAYDPVSFEDAEAMSKRLVGEVAGGVRQVNEARVELGLVAKDGMDIFYPPTGSTGAGAALVGDAAVGQNTTGDNTKD